MNRKDIKVIDLKKIKRRLDVVSRLEEGLKETERALEKLRAQQTDLPEVEVTMLEKLQHKTRHVPKVISAGLGSAAGIAVAAGELPLALILGAASGIVSGFKPVAETVAKAGSKYGPKGQLKREDKMSLWYDIIQLILKLFKKG